ncbi:MAG: PQQ-binding-like beta-propeller repeat protein [Planctomycetaceae bacterium]
MCSQQEILRRSNPSSLLLRQVKLLGGLLLLFPVIAFSQSDASLVHRWQFNPATQERGTFANATDGLPANLSGRPTFSREAPRGLELTGDAKVKNRVVVRDAADGLDPTVTGLPQEALTVEAWVRVDKTMEWGGIVGCMQDNGAFERGWLLGFRNSAFCFAVATKKSGKLTYLTSTRMFEPGYWYQVTGTYDGSEMRLYVDGRLAAKSTAQSGPIQYAPKGPFVIGAYEDENEYYALKGAVEQVSIWNRALSEKDVAGEFRARQKFFPDIIAQHPEVADWPTHLRDNQRTGLVTSNVETPLHLNWVFEQPTPPSPAWPAPANQDFWHKKFNLKARVVYDRASHLVSAGGRVFFGSSSDDTVYCLNAVTGDKLWNFTTEGPVRLSPTVAENRLLVGSDDGHVYCLSTEDGRLLWKHRAVDEDRRVPGNERILSVWPIRTGVLVDEGIAYFCAGLFPQQGVYQVAVDVETGKRLAESKLEISAQGYLARRSGQLYVATGRDPAGKFISKLKRTGKGVGQELAAIPERFRDVFIGSKNLRIGGGDGEVAAFRVEDGKQVWHHKVDGKVWSMAIVGNRLFVSTDAGRIYGFSSKPTETKTHRTVVAAEAKLPSESVRQCIERFRDQRGYALVLNGTDELAIPLARATKLQIVCLQSKTEQVRSTRAAVVAENLQQRVTVHAGKATEDLPYTDYLFNVVIDERFLHGKAATLTKEMKRVTRPLGGVALCSLAEGGSWERGSLEGTGEWTHMYANPANTVCSDDQHVGSEFDLQWFGKPGPQQMLDRHHRTVAPVWKSGRLFVPGNNRVIGVDAYNGTPLWNRAIPNSRRIGAFRDSSYLAAAGDEVYVAAKGECLVLDAQTGEIRKQIKAPGENYEWGYLGVDETGIVGTSSKPGAIRRDYGLDAINEGTFWDARPLVTSDRVFQRGEGDSQWEYLPANGVVVNASLTVSDNKVFAVESTNPKTRDVENGRVLPTQIFSEGSRVTAINRSGGSVAWSVDIGLDKLEHNIHCAFADGKLIVVGSRNSGKDKKTATVLYDVYVLDSNNGEILWKTTQKQGTKIGGDHGEQDHHPVIVGDTLYCEPFAYKLADGTPLKDFAWAKKHRRGCGTVSASASTFYFRQSNPTLFDLETGEYRKVTSSTRPGCWINMIPAGGLLLIPEASSGCTCNYSIQTSLAFLPRKREK